MNEPNVRRVKVRGAQRVKVVKRSTDEIEKKLADFTYAEFESEPYPFRDWDKLKDVIDHIVVIDSNPDNMFADISDDFFSGGKVVENGHIGSIIDASFAKNKSLKDAIRDDPGGFKKVVRFRCGVGDRRPVFRDGSIFFDDSDDYIRLSEIKLTYDTELFAVVTMPEGVNGNLWGSSGLGYAGAFLKNSCSVNFGNPTPIKYEINGVEVVDAGDAYNRAVGNKCLIKVRLNMSNQKTWPDISIGGTDRIEWFLGMKLHGFAMYNRYGTGRALTIPEKRALYKILGA